MSTTDYHFTFESKKQPQEIYQHLLDPKNWWVGFYGEEIKGKSINPGDEFTFLAGGGMHFTKQKLTERIPGQKIEWIVTESNLTFLENEEEWAGTKISFEIRTENNKTKVIFSHVGLTPESECYDQCSSGWNQYLQKLKKEM